MTEQARVLFISSSIEDYLSDSVFLGLRALLGERVVDYPRIDRLYDTIPSAQRQKLYGRGFGLYACLPDISVDRTRIESQLVDGAFDAVIFSDIHRCFGRFVELLPYIEKTRVAVLDGADSPALYPYSGAYWRRPERWGLPRAHTRFLYFKREWTPDTISYRYYRLLPKQLATSVPSPNNLRPIAFSFPDEKILSNSANVDKKALWPHHIVDPEVRKLVNGATSGYAFEAESDYYADLRGARFGITTKRAGWDCLRHYEIAANGAVPCFRNLSSKPVTCAPHGLSEDNSVSYTSAADLLKKIERLSDADYERRRRGALDWARRNSTRQRARQVLLALGVQVSSLSNTQEALHATEE